MATEESAYALTTLEKVKAHASVHDSQYDTELVRMIHAVSSRMESYCGRHFLSRQYVHDGDTLHRLNSTGGRTLVLPEFPVSAISVLKTHPDNDALTEGYDEDFVCDPLTGLVRLREGLLFEGSIDRPAIGVVEITYTAGYAASPSASAKWYWGSEDIGAEIGFACTRQVAFEFKAKSRDADGISSVSTDGGTVSYSARPWLPEVQDTLDRHRRISACL